MALDQIKSTVPETQESTSEEPFNIPNYGAPIGALFLLFIGLFIYTVFLAPRNSTVDYLLDRTHEIEQNINKLETKVSDNSDQLLSMIEDYYSYEHEEAVNIAKDGGYIRFYHFVSVRDGRIVRLADSSGHEIEINITNKVITRFE